MTSTLAHLSRTASGLEPYTPAQHGAWDFEKAAHLLRRSMVGPTYEEITRAVAEGLDVTIDRLFQPFTPSTSTIDEWVGTDPKIWHPQEGAGAVEFRHLNLWRQGQLARWWLKTIVESPVSLQERMTLFWHNHFVEDFRVVGFAQFMHGYNAMLRRNALGNLKAFVRDVTVDMGMLIYLDGWASCRIGDWSNINENYSRELLELFTMGIYDWDGRPNYTQRDVAEGARALSGWYYTDSPVGEWHRGLKSQFMPERWDSGVKTYLGRTGSFGADDVIEIIFSERADQVARFICEKIYRAFVYHIPDRTIVAAMAEILKSGGWEIEPVMRTLLCSAHFFDRVNIGGMAKSHVDFFVGLVRQWKLRDVPDFLPEEVVRFSEDLSDRLRALEQLPLFPPNVQGWAGGRAWVTSSTIPPRQKFALDVASGRIVQGIRLYTLDPVELARGLARPDDARGLCEEMARYLLNTAPTAEEIEPLHAALLNGGVDYEWSLDDPDQNPDLRIRRLLSEIVQLSKFQLY